MAVTSSLVECGMLHIVIAASLCESAYSHANAGDLHKQPSGVGLAGLVAEVGRVEERPRKRPISPERQRLIAELEAMEAYINGRGISAPRPAAGKGTCEACTLHLSGLPVARLDAVDGSGASAKHC